MSIQITEQTIAIWFAPVTEESDYMSCLNLEGEQLVFHFRFRYYQGDQSKKFEESEDRKSWYKMEIDHATPEEALRRVRSLQAAFVEKMDRDAPELAHPLFEVLNDGDFDSFIREFMQQPWTRAKWGQING